VKQRTIETALLLVLLTTLSRAIYSYRPVLVVLEKCGGSLSSHTMKVTVQPLH
jgi:hypothetical protein